MIENCKICNNSFKTFSCKKSKYCSRNCYYKGRKGGFIKFISKEKLNFLYNKKFMTTFQIADELEVNWKTVVRYMNIHGIKRRNKNSSIYQFGRALYRNKEVSEKTREKISEAMLNSVAFKKAMKKKIGIPNPEHSAWAKEYYKKHPEKHPNRILAKGTVSKPQRFLFEILKREYKDAELNYPIPNTGRFADIGIPSLRLDVEYDGSYWHQDKKADLIRDEEIKKSNWKVIRIGEEKLREVLNEKTKETINVEVQSRKVINSFDIVDVINPTPSPS